MSGVCIEAEAIALRDPVSAALRRASIKQAFGLDATGDIQAAARLMDDEIVAMYLAASASNDNSNNINEVAI